MFIPTDAHRILLAMPPDFGKLCMLNHALFGLRFAGCFGCINLSSCISQNWKRIHSKNKLEKHGSELLRLPFYVLGGSNNNGIPASKATQILSIKDTKAQMRGSILLWHPWIGRADRPSLSVQFKKKDLVPLCAVADFLVDRITFRKLGTRWNRWFIKVKLCGNWLQLVGKVAPSRNSQKLFLPVPQVKIVMTFLKMFLNDLTVWPLILTIS